MNKSTALDVASQYATAIAARDGDRMHALRAHTYVLDFVHRDAFQASPLAATEGKDMYRSLFTAFPDSDFEVTCTIAGEEVVVQEWIFTGTNTGRFEQPGFAGSASREPTDNTVTLRGALIYDISGGLVQFALAGIVIVIAVILALVVLRPQPRVAVQRGLAEGVCTSERAPAVVAAVRCITGAAAAVRESASRTAVAVGTSAASPPKGEVVRW